MKNITLSNIRLHAYSLYNVYKIIAISQADITDINDIESRFEDVKSSEWLHLASGIAKITTVAGIGDESAVWCSPIRDEYKVIAEGWNKFAESITVFNFIWIGYEGLIKDLSNASSQVNAGIHYINNNSKQRWEYLQHTTHQLKKLINCIDFPVDLTATEKKSISNNDTSNAKPLRLIGQIRNVFIHSDLEVYSAANNSAHYLQHLLYIINLSSKITLLIIQLITYEHFKDLIVCELSPDLPFKYLNIKDDLKMGEIIRETHHSIYE